jgi:hypothetical protein
VLLLVCVAVVIAQRALSTVSELFPGGALICDLLAALALSYTSACFFNLLVVRLPKRRDKAAFLEVSGNLVAQFSSTAVGILQAMATEHGMSPPTRQPDPAYLYEVMMKVNPVADAPMIGFDGSRYNWIQYTAEGIERAAGIQRRLVPFFPQMEAETVAIAAVENCTLVQTIKRLAAAPMNDSDMQGSRAFSSNSGPRARRLATGTGTRSRRYWSRTDACTSINPTSHRRHRRPQTRSGGSACRASDDWRLDPLRKRWPNANG